jgi:hypothetical protein
MIPPKPGKAPARAAGVEDRETIDIAAKASEPKATIPIAFSVRISLGVFLDMVCKGHRQAMPIVVEVFL